MKMDDGNGVKWMEMEMNFLEGMLFPKYSDQSTRVLKGGHKPTPLTPLWPFFTNSRFDKDWTFLHFLVQFVHQSCYFDLSTVKMHLYI